MRYVAVANHKGGVGKTTTTVCLAGALWELEKEVLIIDLDEQASASDWLGNQRERPGEALAQALISGSGLNELVQETKCGPHLIASCELFHSFQVQAQMQAGAEFLLRDALANLEPRWDYVFFDCPPSLQLITASALVAADFMLVPVETKFLSLSPLGRLMRLFEGVQRRLNPDLQLAGLVAGKAKSSARHCAEVTAELRKVFPGEVFETVIRDSIRIGEAPGQVKGITRYDPTGNGAIDFMALAKEFDAAVARKSKSKPAARSKPRAMAKEVANG